MRKVLVSIPHGEVKDSFLPPHLCQYLEDHFEVIYNETDKHFTKEELKQLLPKVDAIFTSWGHEVLDADILNCAPQLSVIAHTGGTVANLVEPEAFSRPLKILSGNLLYAESVAEGTIAYMLMAQRRLPDYVQLLKDGGWRFPDGKDMWESLMYKKVGIIGLGTIAKFLIPLLHMFHCDICLYSHYDPDPVFLMNNGVRRMDLADVFSQCDIISVHSALNADNRGLIGKELFEKIRDGALFINTSRGLVIDEAALTEELKKNRFRAVLDVYQKEPLPISSELRSMPNVYLVPHMAGPTFDRREHITRALIDNVIHFYEGETYLPLEISKEAALRMTKM